MGNRRSGLAFVGTALRWVAGLEWLAVGLAAPLLILPTVRPLWTAGALALLMVFWLLRWAVRREPWPVTRFNVALLLFALMVPVGVWASPVPELTLPKAAGLILGLAVFRTVPFSVQERSHLVLALIMFILLGLAILVGGVLGAGWISKVPALAAVTAHIPRLLTGLPELHAEAISPNQVAGALTLYFPLAAALAVGWPWRRRFSVRALAIWLVLLVFPVLVGGTLLLTQSRSGWIGAGVGILALVVLAGLTSRQRWARWFGVAVPALVALSVVAIVLRTGPQKAVKGFYDPGAENPVEQVTGDITLAGRVEIWSRALYAVQDFPFTGCGLGAFRRVVHILYPLFLVPPDTDIGHAHNIFLQTAVDLGIPGLVGYLSLLIVATAIGWRAARQGDARIRPLALGLLGGLAALHAYGMTDALALGSKPAVAFWYALGLMAALDRLPVADPAGGTAGSRRIWALVWGVLLLAVLAVGGWGLWRMIVGANAGEVPGTVLPVYPAAGEVTSRTESPAPGSGWTGPLAITTFTTTHPITDVVNFYSGALTEGGWVAEVESRDGLGWGGVWARDGGQEVCLVNLFQMERETSVSVMCGRRRVLQKDGHD